MVSQTHENFELPSPQPAEGLDQVGDTIEARPLSSPENSPSVNTSPAVSSAQSVVSAILPTQKADDPLGSVSAPISSTLTPRIPDGFEKVWVEKAKKVIRETRDDPRAQNTEIGKVKSDYMKAAYSKDIKLQE